MPSADDLQLPLWDFGWLIYRDIPIPKCETLEDTLAAYVQSAAFGATFAQPEPDVSPLLHGPFPRSTVRTSDFRELTLDDLRKELDSIRSHDVSEFPPSLVQWQPIESLIMRLHRTNTWTLILNLNETSPEKHDELGWVLLLFRELLFASPRSGMLSRAVFGYD